MDTRLLQTFVTLARTGSFTATAAQLRMAQSTVTVQIRNLERTLGTRLFDRLPNGARLTETARRLLDEAQAVLEAQARLFAAANERGPVTGQVAVGAGETLCSARMPAVIAALRRDHPDLDVNLRPAGTAEAVQGLRTGELDVALLLEDRVDFPDIAAERLGHEPLVLVCAPDHPLAHRGQPATWAELARESFFLHEQGCSYSDRMASTLSASSDVQPRLTRFGSIEAARSCVAAGLGLTVLPRANVQHAIEEGHLATVAGPQPPDVPVYVARNRRRWTSRAAQTVIDELTRHYRSTGAGTPRPERAGRTRAHRG
jgi:DNA-binding transcriptional LysR family regulator